MKQHIIHMTHGSEILIDSDIEWGRDKEKHFSFEISEDEKTIISSNSYLFESFENKELSELIKYIELEEKKFKESIDRSRANFLSKQQKDLLMYEEEKKKQRAWEEERWTEMEKGEGYFSRK